MKLNIMSDVHNEFSLMPVPKTGADVVILAGDIHIGNRAIDWAQQFEKPVIYLMGNHEYYKNHFQTVNQRIKEASVGTNVYILDNDEVVIKGVRFIGGTLWTDFNLFGDVNMARLHAQDGMNDYRLIRYGAGYRKLKPIDTQILFENTVAFLKDRLTKPFTGQTVVVTHHAPSFKSVHPVYMNDKLTPAYASNLEHLMGDPINLWVHGHVHHSNDYVINGTRIISNPRGYHDKDDRFPENPLFRADLVIEV